MEVVHKEVRKSILCNINEIIDGISFNNNILNSLNIHNNNIHSVTRYKLVFLIRSEDPEIYEDIINNIKKTYKDLEKDDDNNYILKIGDHLVTKRMTYKIWKTLKSRKNKYKLLKLHLTVTKNFNYHIIKIVVDEDRYNFKKGENYFIYPKHVKLINEIDWKTIIFEIQKDAEDYKKKILYQILKRRKIK